MKTSDLPVLVAIALGLAMAFTAAVLARYGSSTTAADWTQSIFTGVAVVIALGMPVYERRKKQAHDQTVAMMQVAARLRPWMRLVADAVFSRQMNEHSDGEQGSEVCHVPVLPLDVDVVSLLSAARAKKVFSLMELRERAEAQVRDLSAFEDRFNQVETYYHSMACLFIGARTLYREFARETDLHELTSHRWELNAINKAALEGNVRGWTKL